MKITKPVSYLRDNYEELSQLAHETSQPIFLTQNGQVDLVVLSIECLEQLQLEGEVYFKLKEAEMEAEMTPQRFTSKDILEAIECQSHTKKEMP